MTASLESEGGRYEGERLLLTELMSEDTAAAVSTPLSKKEKRKLMKRQVKEQRRALRQGLTEKAGKPCHLCEKNVKLLIRCRIDETLEWRMVCGPCWPRVSGGVVDGDASHPWYTYGGLWKQR